MSASDFAMTVAVGSLFSSVISKPDPPVVDGLIALIFLFLSQLSIASLRKRCRFFSSLIDNKPLLLMKDGIFLDSQLRRSNITRHDIIAKLREANVAQMAQVKAVVFETTGDISVLHSLNQDTLDDTLLENVLGPNTLD